VTLKLVIENVKHKPMRSFLSILVIAVPVAGLLTLVGLSRGMLNDAEHRARGSGADIMVRGKDSNAALSASTATLSPKFLDYFATLPHVVATMGVVTHSIETLLTVNGVDLKDVDKLNPIHYVAGGGFQGDYDILIDQYYAKQKKKKVGDTMEFMNKSWRISGIFEGGQLTHILAPLKTLQELDETNGKFTLIYLKLDNPANTQTVIEELEKTMKGYPIWSMEDFATRIEASVNQQGLNEFIGVIVGIGVVIGFGVVCLSMYMAVLQRTREIGILKSLGGSKGFILRIIWMEALFLGAGGTLLGIALSIGARYLIQTLKPATFQVEIVYSWWLLSGVITLAGASLGALYPGLSAASHDAIEALAYE